MKNLWYIIIVLTAGLLLYFATFNSEKTQPNDTEQKQKSSNTAQSRWETKIDEQPPVSIQITPVELESTVNQWKFAITLTAHSGNLDQDLTQTTTLLDDQGNIYKPAAWEGPGPGGHHRQGILIFAALNPRPLYVELKIKNVGGVIERSFKWSLK